MKAGVLCVLLKGTGLVGRDLFFAIQLLLFFIGSIITGTSANILDHEVILTMEAKHLERWKGKLEAWVLEDTVQPPSVHRLSLDFYERKK